MRRFLELISVTTLVLAWASSAQAKAFVGSVSFAFGTPFGTPPGLAASGSGTGKSTVVPNVLTIQTPSWAANGPTLITYPPTAAPRTPFRIVLTAPGPCSFAGAGGPRGGLGGACALSGTANALVAGAPFLIIPLSGLGVAGRTSFGPYGSYIDAQSWTTGTAVATVNGVALTMNGVPIVMTGFDSRSPGGTGFVRLVAPGGFMSTLGGNFPLFVSMTLNFIPEPGTLLLLGSGVAGLALLGRRRMQSRS